MHLTGGRAVSILTGLAESFDRNAWVVILLISLWIAAVLRLTNFFALYHIRSHNGCFYLGKLFRGTYWDTIALSFGQENPRQLKKTVTKNFPIVIWLLWVAVIQTGVTKSLTATLSTSVTTLPFNSPDSLAASDFHIIARPGTDLFQFHVLANLQRKVTTTETPNSDAVIQDILADTSKKLKVATPCPFDDSADCSNKGITPAFDLGMFRWVSIMQVKVNSSLTTPITMKMQSLLQAGITNHMFHLHKIMSYRDQHVARNYKAHKNLNGITESRPNVGLV